MSSGEEYKVSGVYIWPLHANMLCPRKSDIKFVVWHSISLHMVFKVEREVKEDASRQLSWTAQLIEVRV